MMKRILICSIAASVLLVSCNNQQQPAATAPAVSSDVTKLESKDVHGTITYKGSLHVFPSTLTTDDPNNASKNVTLEGIGVDIGENLGIRVMPALGVFDTLVSKTKKDLEFWGKYRRVEVKPNSFLYYYSKEIGGTEDKGYNFIVVIKGKSKQYEITGVGKTSLDPIADSASAIKAMQVALTFTPAD
jgi:hypothetical protein